MPEQLKFHFIKSPTFFEAPLHGFYSGVNGDGKVILCPFSERMAIPQEQIFEASSDTPGLAHLIGSDGKEGVVRTVHGALYLDAQALRSIISSLEEIVANFEQTK